MTADLMALRCGCRQAISDIKKSRQLMKSITPSDFIALCRRYFGTSKGRCPSLRARSHHRTACGLTLLACAPTPMYSPRHGVHSGDGV